MDDRAAKTIVIAVCVYETMAIITGRAPTITKLCRRRRTIEAALLAIVLIHLHHRQPDHGTQPSRLAALRAPRQHRGSRLRT